MILCLPLLDDARLLKARPDAAPRLPERCPETRWLRAAACTLLMAAGAGEIWQLFARKTAPRPLSSLQDWLGPLRSVNSYGLFAVMTTTRPEIIIEGTLDGKNWKEYQFKWKIGDPGRRPGFMAPHMPRLDWQMWFAALGDYQSNPWLLHLMGRLATGSEPVKKLLAADPFPGQTPRAIRSVLYEYRFTGWSEGRKTGAWWTRRFMGAYSPTLERRP